MVSASEHYALLLAPIYVWMSGGLVTALAQGAADMAEFTATSADGEAGDGIGHAGRHAIDLGAGFGAHAVPLARAGYHVTAVDSSPLLLSELRRLSDGLAIRLVADDLVGFRQYVRESADLILCMGDTLTHLPDRVQVERLFREVAAALAPAGRVLLTFRDYTTARVGGERFVMVRSDAQRILTCFLEEQDERMLVHDLVHERVNEGWQLRVSSYRKLRLSPAWVVAALHRVGLEAERGQNVRGMVRIGARLRAAASR